MADAKENIFKFTFSPCEYAHYYGTSIVKKFQDGFKTDCKKSGAILKGEDKC
jgi:hypothetical protein